MMKSFILFIFTLLILNSLWAQNPGQTPHVRVNENCRECHSTVAWKPVSFDHSTTEFELLGQHLNVDCKDCHDLRDFAIVDSRCSSCHDDVHQNGLGGDCNMCHTETNWIIFDIYDIHKNTEMPLIGKHARLDCQYCHRTQQINEYRLMAVQCVDCHRDEYLTVENPNHIEFGFSENCSMCHQYLSFRPANWREHDEQFFPIFRGTHQGTWESCYTCHDVPGNFKHFNCLGCHEHSMSRMNGAHDDVRGYVYDSNACYNCHPTGVGED
jgi:hypothetical protein